MAVIFETLTNCLAITAAFVGICLYLYLKSSLNYWKDRGVPYLKPLPFFGNLKDQLLGIKGPSDLYQDFYDSMKNERYFGFFEMQNPVLMIKDPELIEQILVKDFHHFYDRGFHSDPENDPLSANLFNLEGKQWRTLRYKLTPTFATEKLKGMFEQICVCGGGLVKVIEEESKKNKSIKSKPLLSSFAFDVIASIAFGLQLDKDTDENKNFQKVFGAVIQPKRLQMFRFFAILYMPNLAKAFGIKQFSQNIEDVVMHLVRDTLKYRTANNVIRNDFLQLLLNLQKQERDGTLSFDKDLEHYAEDDDDDDIIDQLKHLSRDEEQLQLRETQKAFITESVIAAQSFVFLTAGSESVSSTVNFALYCLSQRPEIQKKVHYEIDSIMAHNYNKWSFQAVKEMTYLEQVVQETLRMYPIAPILFRVCTESYKVPNSTLTIEKGTRITIPIRAIHNDPQYYESPQVFDPDRFQGNNFKANGKFLPFGDGPRICIAMRFAVLEIKVVLARILDQYSVKLSPKTQLPLMFRKNSFFLVPARGFYFEFDKRRKI